jgi:hypothetical protein
MIFLVCLIVSYKLCMGDVSIDPHFEWTRKDFSMEELSLLEMELVRFLLAVQNQDTAKASIVLSPQLAGKVSENNQSQESSNAAANSTPRHSSMSPLSPDILSHSNQDHVADIIGSSMTATPTANKRVFQRSASARTRASGEDGLPGLNKPLANATLRPQAYLSISNIASNPNSPSSSKVISAQNSPLPAPIMET